MRDEEIGARSIAAALCASPFHGATISMSGASRAMSAEIRRDG